MKQISRHSDEGNEKPESNTILILSAIGLFIILITVNEAKSQNKHFSECSCNKEFLK